ncbi:MAG: GNAT family N-acetyltransferase [Balneolaceae bacterium]|jgi:putative acetyltransferase
MYIRLFKKGDAEQVSRLFNDTVQIVNKFDYSETQINNWPADNIHLQDWEANCLDKFTLVAEDNQRIIAFAQFEDHGHIDGLYCHHEYQRMGIGSQLFDAMEDYARSKGLNKIYTEANITTRPFFMKMGFSYVQKQRVLVHGDMVTVYVMEKEI